MQTTTETLPTVPPGAGEGSRTRPRLRPPVVIGAYVTIFASRVISAGLPIGIQLVAWLIGGIAVTMIAIDPTRLTSVVRDWGLLAVMGLFYASTPGLADNLGVAVNVRFPIEVDRLLGLGQLPTHRLQDWWPQDGPATVFDIPVSLVYVSHFFATPLASAILWVKDYGNFWRYMRRYYAILTIGVSVYFILPTMPPWLAAEEGHIGEVTRSSWRGWEFIPLGFDRVIAIGHDTANPVAAIPSLHAAMALFLGWWCWRRTTSGVARAFWAAYPVAMAFVLVLTGEHYVTDIVLGFALVAVVMWAADRLEGRPSADDDVAPTVAPASAPFNATID